MRAAFGDYITATVQDADIRKTHQAARFGPGLVSVAVVVILEIIAVVLLLILYLPPDTVETSTVIVNATTALTPPRECHTWQDRTVYGDGIPVPNWPPGDLYITAPISGADIYSSVLNSTCYAPWGEGSVGTYFVYGYAERILGRMQMECNNSLLPEVKSYMWDGNVALSSQQVYQKAQEYLYQWSSHPNAVNSAYSLNTTILYNSNSTTAKGSLSLSLLLRQAGNSRFGCIVQVTIFCDHGLNAVEDALGLSALSPMQVAELNTTGLCAQMAKNNRTCVDTFYHKPFSVFADPLYFRVQGPIIDCFDMAYFGVECPEDLANFDTPYWGDWPDYEAPGGAFGDVDLSGVEAFIGFIPSMGFFELGFIGNGCPGRVIANDYFDPTQWPGADAQLRSVLAVYNESKPYTFQCKKLVPPTFMGRISFVWPIASVIHTVAMTLIVRYIYKAAVVSRDLFKRDAGHKTPKASETGDSALPGQHSAEEASERSAQLPPQVRWICGLADEALQKRHIEGASLYGSPSQLRPSCTDGPLESQRESELLIDLGPSTAAEADRTEGALHSV